MRKLFILLILFICSCSTIKTKVPQDFVYIPINTKNYIIASWQKITNIKAPIRIYIEGDGCAYTKRGYPSTNPTPKSYFLRNIAFRDTNYNVVYLARPCQYIKNKNSNSIDWTTGRFSQKIVDNMKQAIKLIAKDNKIILIGYSGGALLSGLIINQNLNDLNIVKWITITGLLNHTKWTNYFGYEHLQDSLELTNLPNIEQIHYIAKKDKTIPYKLTLEIVKDKNYILIENATHNSGIKINYNNDN